MGHTLCTVRMCAFDFPVLAWVHLNLRMYTQHMQINLSRLSFSYLCESVSLAVLAGPHVNLTGADEQLKASVNH